MGLMSGTSIDGIDAALVDFSDNTTPRLICTHSHSWPASVFTELLTSRDIPDEKLKELHPLDIRLGEIFAEATIALLEKAKLTAKDIIAIGNHGQTLRHRPNANPPFSLQFGDARTLAQKTGIRVVSNFRTADIEAGGQGAPLAPAFHAAVFRNETEPRGILNIGGIANLTLLPTDPRQTIIGFDTGPGNNMMDAWMIKSCGQRFDDNGHFARTGQINEILLQQCLSDDYFHASPPKSTGFEQFNLSWFNKQVEKCVIKDLDPADVQATLCELTARSIATAVMQESYNITRVLVCGGGVHNSYLMERLQCLLSGCKVESTDVCGIHPDWVEAITFAWLAKQTINGLPGNIPSVTGAKEAVVLGQITDVE